MQSSTLQRDPMADVYSRYGKMKMDALPSNCSGMSVLDIGGYDGRFALECLKRGATKATVLDNGEYRTYLNHDGLWPEPEKHPGIEYVEGDFMKHYEGADIVIFYNVLYHCENWLNAIPYVGALTKRWMCLSTYFVPGSTGWEEYTETGTDQLRASPTLPGLFASLEGAFFRKWEHLQIADDHVVMRCR